MIKNIFAVITCMLIFCACSKKTEDLFDKPVDQRLTEATTNLQNYLVNAPGWKLFVYPQGLESEGIHVGGFTYYLNFTSNNRVTMVSDFSPAISAIPKESGYNIKALQRPSLIFDTYSYMHIPADPDPNVSLSPITSNGGYGYGTDFNFSFKDITPRDTMYLIGNFNNSEAVLVKATQAEMDGAFKNKELQNIINESYKYPVTNPFLYFPASPTLNVGIGFDFRNILITFSYLNGTALISTAERFSFTTYGIHLGRAVTIGIYTFQDIFWDNVKKVYYITSGSTRVEVGNSSTPPVVVSLTTIIGNQYKTITVPPGAKLPNTSTLFLQKYNTAANAMLTGPYGLKLDKMNFIFNAATKSMLLSVDVYQGANGFLLDYNYSYTVDASGYFKFTKISQNGNAGLVTAAMNNLLVYIDNDDFKIDGVATSLGFLGTFTSKQNPAFYFSGNLY